MTIKGLTDQTAAFPRIGELRKGDKKPERGPGKDLTYFRFTSDDALANKMFTEAYPDQEALRNIHVFLPHKTADENIDSWIEKWLAGGLVYRSDGETIVLWRTPTGAYSLEPKPDTFTELDANGKRKDGGQQVGRMSVIIPELGRFATVTILTTSKHDIINLTRQLRSYEALRGDLRGIPFVVKRRPYRISTPGQGGKRERREKWLLSIETQPQWTMKQLGAMERAALPEGEFIDLPEDDYTVSQLPDGVSDPFETSAPDDAPPWDDESQQPEPQPQPAPVQPTAPTNGGNGHSKLTRPMSPEQVKTAAAVKSLKSTKPAGEAQLDFAASSLSKALDGDDDKRYLVTEFLFGFTSLKNATSGQCSFLIDWIGAKKENEYTPSEDALKEIDLILRQVQIERGQTDMFNQSVSELDEFFGHKEEIDF